MKGFSKKIGEHFVPFIVVLTALLAVSCAVDPLPTVFVSGVSLNQSDLIMTEGDSHTLVAAVTPSNAADVSVSWSSNSTSVATVDQSGNVTACKAGYATITVTTADGGYSASCVVTVIPKIYPVASISLDKTVLSLIEGEAATLNATFTPSNATNRNVTWSTSDASVATVDQNGEVYAVKAGTATITVTTEDGGKTATCEVSVLASVSGVSLNKNRLELVEGSSETLYATITPSNAANKKVTWSSSNSSVATVDDNGKVTAVMVGTATITVTTEDGGKSATCEVSVVIPVSGVSLNKSSLELNEGETETLYATVTPSDATNKVVTWKSSNTSVATVNADGKVTAVKAGTATITVTTENGGKTATCEVTVSPPPYIEVESLQISFTNTSGTIGGYLYIGKNYGFSVSCTPSNATVNYEWTVEDQTIASISGNGKSATLSTKEFGKTAVIVTEKNSGKSKRYDFGTCVTDFHFTENTGETNYGYPMITMVVGEKYKLNYSYSPSYASNIFSDLRAFNIKEVLASINTYVIVDEPTIVDIDASGTITAKKIGTTIIASNNSSGVCKSGDNDGVFINVVSEYTEKEYNDDFQYATLIKPGQKMKFSLSSSSDIDVFKFTSPAENFDVKVIYYGDYSSSSGTRILSYDLFNSSYTPFGSGNLSFDASGGEYSQARWLNTTQGYIKFFMKDEYKTYFTPNGYFTVEFIPK